MRRLTLHFLIVGFLLLIPFVPAALAQAKTTGRDWRKHPAIVEVDTANDIYAIGDVHGDYDRLISLLTAVKIIPRDPGAPEKVQWLAGKATLVCTGDMIDKWTQSCEVIALFRHLQTEARRAGGQVIVTLGNHEAEFLADPTGTKTRDFRKDLKRHAIKSAQVADGTDPDGIGSWLRSLPVAVRVNDCFFVHAGNTHQRTLPQLRDDLMAGIDKEGFSAPVLIDEKSLLLARMHPLPWWEDPKLNAAENKELLAKNVRALGVKHLVMGHQPDVVTFADQSKRPAGEMWQHGDGLIFLIDTGMSRGVGFSPGAVLQLSWSKKEVQAIVIDARGESRVLWPKMISP